MDNSERLLYRSFRFEVQSYIQ